MNNKIFIYLVFQLLVAALLAKDSLQFSFSPSNDIVRAVIVLAPGMNTDGAFFFERITVDGFCEAKQSWGDCS